ncbi:MAG: hypothetical protein HRT71_01175 [Flavobacteriales bacterium]|nr:hypothetical protein [Flavobacteriales bacterium]
MEFIKYGFTLYSNEEATELLMAAGFENVEVFEQTEPEIEFNGKVQIFKSICLKATK